MKKKHKKTGSTGDTEEIIRATISRKFSLAALMTKLNLMQVGELQLLKLKNQSPNTIDNKHKSLFHMQQ